MDATLFLVDYKMTNMWSGIIAMSFGVLARLLNQDEPFRGDANFDLNPGGKEIVFVGPGQGGYDLWKLNLVTRQRIRISRTPEQENSPAIGDKGEVYFTSYGAQGSWERLYQIVDGKATLSDLGTASWQRTAVPLADHSLAVVTYSEITKYGLGSRMPTDFNLEWFPTDRKSSSILCAGFKSIMLFPGCESQGRILFTGSRNFPEPSRVWSISMNHGGPKVLGSLSDVWCVTASADGTLIAAVAPSKPGEFGHDVYVMSHDGSDIRRLTQHEARIIQVRFEPDGKSILFVVGQNFSYDLYRVTLDGKTERICTLVD